MAEFASKGVAGTGLGLGIAGTTLGLLNNGFGNGLFGLRRCHLSEHLAKMWVDSMVNKDGTQGCQWTVEQTNQYNHNHHKWDWFAIMNMMYSDYYNPKFSASDYADMADAWFNDPDAKDGKTFHYFMHIVL